MINWHELLHWFLIGVAGGLGFLVIGTIYRLIIKG
jgi:hypothetical protein